MSAATYCDPVSVFRSVGQQTPSHTGFDGTGQYDDFIALAVTPRPQAEHGLPIAPDDLAVGTLPAPSWIRTNRIVTLNISLVVKTVGRLYPRAIEAAVHEVCAFIKAS